MNSKFSFINVILGITLESNKEVLDTYLPEYYEAHPCSIMNGLKNGIEDIDNYGEDRTQGSVV